MEECPERLVEGGKCVFGTFAGHPERLDIRNVSRAYLDLPIPKVITNLRIKSRLSFFFTIGEYIGCVDFFDAKIVGMADVNFWNQTTKQRFSYRSVMGPRKRFVPHKLNQAGTSSYKKSRYIRINWDREHDKLSAIFDLKGDSVRPSASGALKAFFPLEPSAELTCVTPAPTFRRCSARYYASLPLHGSITLVPRGEPPKTMPDADGICFFEVNRTYMKFFTSSEFAVGMGVIDGKNVSFKIEAGSQDAVDPDKYNGNVLFYADSVTPLPPVTITHSYGLMKTWNIQDTENMIDLTFTPISDNVNVINAIVFRTEYHTIYGTFNGVLLTKDGEKVNVNGMPGLTKKYVIRL